MKNSQIETILLEKNYTQYAIDSLFSERQYQEALWNDKTTDTAGMHTNEEFLVFIQDYLREAINIVSRNAEPKASNKAAHNLRKITAMVLASAEKNDWIEELLSTEWRNMVKPDGSLVTSLSYLQSYTNKGFDAATCSWSNFDAGDFTLHTAFVYLFNIGMSTMSISKEFSPLR